MYKEYSVMQPLQRSYSITEESINSMLQAGALADLYNEAKVLELEEKGTTASAKEEARLKEYYKTKPMYESIKALLFFI
jgi:type I restriction enzyme M protein